MEFRIFLNFLVSRLHEDGGQITINLAIPVKEKVWFCFAS